MFNSGKDLLRLWLTILVLTLSPVYVGGRVLYDGVMHRDCNRELGANSPKRTEGYVPVYGEEGCIIGFVK
ncbi:MAG: hypothetical protein Q8P13_02315 [bacterium]|nr:hypothetical protein [bacterium]